jgi:ubiquitin carboxyl-terminal hydrolase 35/38
MPEPVTSTVPSPGPKNSDRLDLNDLIAKYLHPERLDGENKYFCDNCRQLRDAERTARITSAPDHLIVVLKRFSYNKVLQRKSKICRDVFCPEEIGLPVDAGREVLAYSLYAAVIHSGMNSDSGHYYCYAKHQVRVDFTEDLID